MGQDANENGNAVANLSMLAMRLRQLHALIKACRLLNDEYEMHANLEQDMVPEHIFLHFGCQDVCKHPLETVKYMFCNWSIQRGHTIMASHKLHKQ